MKRLMIAAVALALTVTAAGADEKVEPKSNEKIKKLQIERRDLLERVVAMRGQHFWAGTGTMDVLISAAKDLLVAELAVATKPEARLAAHVARVSELARKTEKLVADRYEAGRVTAADNLAAKADRMEAEVGWLKAGGVEKKEKKDK